MVLILANFSNFAENSTLAQKIIYREDVVDDQVRFRIQAELLGYDSTYISNDGSDADQIREFLNSKNAIRISEAVSDEIFFGGS